jgi:hypothetical protein
MAAIQRAAKAMATASTESTEAPAARRVRGGVEAAEEVNRA